MNGSQAARCNFFPIFGTFALERRCSDDKCSAMLPTGTPTMFHPLQLASALLVLVFATALVMATQFLRQQQLSSHQPRLVLQLAAMPL